MSKNLTIPTIWTAVDQMTPTILKMSKGIEGMALRSEIALARNERFFKRVTPAFSEAQKQLLSMAGTGALIGGAFAIGRFSINSLMDYETALDSLQAVTGVSNEKLGEFKKEIDGLSKTAKKSPIELAKSFETIGSNMSQYLDDPKGLRMITEAGVTLSKASREQLEPSLNNLTSIMNQFQLKAEQAGKAVNILTAGEIVGSVRTNQVAGYLQEFGATAKNMNVDLAESTALIEALGVQMDKSKIGVAARNLLTIIGSAGGLDKNARKDLKKSGVDIKFLMDNTQSLSARLHELSKISKDPVKMVSIFGRENVTAGQVIFNQLGTYDKWVDRIRNTNEAQNQAATNSGNLSTKLSELSAKWVQMLTSSGGTSSAMEKASNAVTYVTNNLETIVDVGVDVLKFFALWKGALIVSRGILYSYNVALGINGAITGIASIAIGKNTVALGAYNIATKLTTASTYSLSAAIAANPLGAALIAVTALAGGIYLLSKRQDELLEKYREKIQVDSAQQVNKETDAVKKLVAEYWNLGKGIKEATIEAIKFKKNGIAFERSQVESEISKIKSELAAEKNKLYFSDLFYGGGTPMIGRRGELADQLLQKEQQARQLSDKNLAITQFAKYQIDQGIIGASDVGGVFKNPAGAESNKPSGNWAEQFAMSDDRKNFRFYDQPKQQIELTINNNSDGKVDGKSGGKTFSIMPQTTSTMTNGNTRR